MLAGWHDGFDRDPQRALADLISGRAALGSVARVGVPEFLAQEFGGTVSVLDQDYPAEQTARAQRFRWLDEALLGWLRQMVGEAASAQVRRLGAEVYARRLCDALVAVQWLALPGSLGDLRERREWWYELLLPWRMSSARDPALELRRALTLGQIDQSLLSLWLRLADDPRDEYFAVALAGLQGLPEAGDGAAIQQHCLHALLRHAALQPDAGQARSAFHREYAVLRARYPRTPSQWDATLRRVLAVVEHGLRGRVGRHLRDDLISTGQGAGGRRVVAVRAPVKKLLKDALEADIKKSQRGSGDELATRLISITEQDLSYARHSGDSYFFTRTLHNLGTRLIKAFNLSAPSLDRLGHLVEESLIWEPGNPYLWLLLADWFGARQWLDQREWALREAARLFPLNEPARVELAQLLIQRGEDHWDEAEWWLREVAGFSARNEHSRVELARLLIQRGKDHWDEAERWLREVAGFSARHEHSRLVLAALLYRRGPGHHAEARQLLEAVLRANPANAPAQQLIEKLFESHGKEADFEVDLALADGDWAQFLDDPEASQPSDDPSLEDPYGVGGPEPQPANSVVLPAPNHDRAEPLAPPEAPLTAPVTPALWQTMQRLRGRGKLQAAFMAALTTPGFTPDVTPVPARLSQAAARGDLLAGLYVQWLSPGTALEPPPYAWAWRACRLWQGACPDAAVWQDLAVEFPQHRTATLVLQSRVTVGAADVQKRAEKLRERLLQESAESLSAEQACALSLMSQDATVDPGTVFALLHCAALAAPEFEGRAALLLAS